MAGTVNGLRVTAFGPALALFHVDVVGETEGSFADDVALDGPRAAKRGSLPRQSRRPRKPAHGIAVEGARNRADVQ